MTILYAVQRNRRVTHLGLRLNGIGDSGAGALAAVLQVRLELRASRLPCLESSGCPRASHVHVGMQRAPLILAHLVEQGENRCALRSLNLESNSVEDEGCVALADALKVGFASFCMTVFILTLCTGLTRLRVAT